MDSHNVWDQILARIETKINRHSFYTWFKPTSFVEETAEALRVRVPNALFRDWLAKHYAGLINEALAEIDRPMVTIEFVAGCLGRCRPPPRPRRLPPEEVEEARRRPSSRAPGQRWSRPAGGGAWLRRAAPDAAPGVG
jgi:chromosomal replication initiator protein